MNVLAKPDHAGSNRENFVSRLYQMLDTPQFAGIVSWNETEEGPSFVIFDTAKFQEQVLVNEFSHANFSSFVRQLNKYDFHKVKFRDPHSRVWEFRHPLFRPENRNRPHLIKRKQQSSGRRLKRGEQDFREQAEKAAEIAARDAEDSMKGHITDLEARVDRLEQNNMQIVNALKMQQSLVERLLHAINITDSKADEQLSESTMATDGRIGENSVRSPMQPQRPPQEQLMSQFAPQGMPMEHAVDPNRRSGANTPSYSIDATSLDIRVPSEPASSSALIAVNDDRVREILIRFLLNFGSRVESVDNGLDVVQRVENNQYDYILVDSILKALDGISAIELIRQTNQATPIILLSDPSSSDEHEMYMQKGINAVLYRPFSQAKLYSALQQFRI